MLSRALSLAAVTLLICDLTAVPARAQVTNLEAGKSPSQIFAGTCTACHKSPRGLLKTVPAGSLSGFLRQHYTTSPEMAGLLSSYLISNGAADTRYGGQTRPDKDARSAGRSEGKPGGPVEQPDRQGHRLNTATPSPEPTRPEAEPRQAAAGAHPQGEPERRGRNGKLLAPPEEGTKSAEAAGREAGELAPGGHKLKRRLSKRGRHDLEEPKYQGKADTAKTDVKTETHKEEPAAAGPAEEKPAGEATKEEAAKPESVKPPAEGQSETAKTESPQESAKENAPKENAKEPAGQAPPLTADSPAAPASPVAPAPSAAVPATAPESAAGSPSPSTRPASAAVTSAPPAAQSEAVEAAAPSVSTPSAPPPSGAPAGSPTPSVSQ
ncbi:MAG: hypothetical protein KGQ48_09225 [Bradyrhizobium sp.]|nr:hypothetical protein [Bradyrhizobium sp.]